MNLKQELKSKNATPRFSIGAGIFAKIATKLRQLHLIEFIDSSCIIHHCHTIVIYFIYRTTQFSYEKGKININNVRVRLHRSKLRVRQKNFFNFRKRTCSPVIDNIVDIVGIDSDCEAREIYFSKRQTEIIGILV